MVTAEQQDMQPAARQAAAGGRTITAPLARACNSHRSSCFDAYLPLLKNSSRAASQPLSTTGWRKPLPHLALKQLGSCPSKQHCRLACSQSCRDPLFASSEHPEPLAV